MLIPNVPMPDYVLDRIPGATGPTLSSHIAHRLLTRSAAHAREAHPILNPGWQTDEDRGFDLGVAAHAVILEGKELAIIEAPDYRTKAAQVARDTAISAGGIPALSHQAGAVALMAQRVHDAIAESPDLQGLGELLPERTYLWRVGDAWCRCRPDWITTDSRVILSLKTTRASAEPRAFLRTILSGGYHTQAAFELAAIRAAVGIDAKYVWIAVEAEPPYAVSLVGMAPMFLDLARRTFERAVALWSHCLAAGSWPGYSDRIEYAEPPEWAVAQWAERHMYATAGGAEDGTVDDL